MEKFADFFSQLPRPVMFGIFVIVVAGLIYCLAQLVKGVAKSGKTADPKEIDKTGKTKP